MRRRLSRTQSGLARPFAIVSTSERRRAEGFYLDLMGRTPSGGGRASERRRAEEFYLDLMGRAPPGVQGESAALVEDAAEDQTKQQLRDQAIEKARTKKTFLSAATVRAAVDERASSAELARLFDAGVAAAVPHRRRADARGSDYSAQLVLYWGLVDAYAQRIVDLLERAAVRDWTQAMPEAKASRPGKRLEGVMAAQGPLTDFKIDTSTDAKGIPTFSYRADVGAFTETADSAFPDARKAAAQVQRGRDRVQKTMMRTFVRINQPTNAGRMAGFERSARVLADAAVQARASQAEKDVDRKYGEWLKTAKTSSDLASFSSFEGDPASMQGSDKANLTWGPGIAASGGGFQRLMKDVIDKSPEAKQAFLDVGISMVAQTETGRWDFQLMVVDTEKKWILVSTDAELFIRSRPDLLAMFVNVAQGYTDDLVNPVDGLREIYLKAISARIPRSDKVWKSKVAKLMAQRGVHSGSFGWGDFNENMSPDQVRAVLLTKLSRKLVDQIQESAGGGKPKTPPGQAPEGDVSEGTATFPTLMEAWNADKRRIVFFFKPITTTFTDDAGGTFSARFWLTSDAVKWKIPASERDLLADWNRFKEADPIDQDGDMLCRLPCSARQNQAFANALKLHPDPSKPGAEDGLINHVAPIRSDMAPEPCLLLTPYLYARRYQQVSCKIDQVGRDTGKPIVAEAAKHNQYLNQKTTAFMRARNDSYRVPSLGDPGKIWAITNRMYVSRADNGQPSAINYGWHGPNGKLRSAIPGLTCIQSVGTRHDDRHFDYSQVCVLVAGWCEVTEPGQSAPTWVKTESVYTTARLCKLVTEDGTPLRRVRYET